MSKITSISLGEHFLEFINQEIESGKYNSTSEVIRSALRLLQQQEQQEENLRRALENGERSDVVDDFNPSNHLLDLHSRHS